MKPSGPSSGLALRDAASAFGQVKLTEAVEADSRQVSPPLSTLLAAAGVFAVTNVDDIIVVIILFSATRTSPSLAPRDVVLGQYLGIAALTVLSSIAATGLLAFDDHWVGLAGLVPIGLGLRGIFRATRDDVGQPSLRVDSAFGVAGVTIANGADNISVYSPLFHDAGVAGTLAYVAVFAVLVGVWCVVGRFLGGRRVVIAVVDAAGRWLVPLVFIVIGVLIVLDAGTVGYVVDR